MDELGHMATTYLREDVYERALGEYVKVFHPDDVERQPHIDVYVHPPSGDRAFYTLITGGLSDVAMVAPAGQSRRVELVMYVDEPNPLFAGRLAGLARLPVEKHTWLGWGHSSACGSLAAGSTVTALVLVEPPFEEEAQICSELVVDGEPVTLFWALPLTQAELEYKMANGTSALLQKFETIPATVDVSRPSVV